MGGGPPDRGLTTLTAQAVPISSLAQRLSWQVGHTVLDMTGLKGNYDFTLQWKPDFSKSSPGEVNAPQPSDSGVLPAIQQELGLKLEPPKALMEILVVDHVEKPSEN